MEQWEKDYLEQISRSKKSGLNTSENYNEHQREYINECWEEVIRADGSKWYVPNQKAIRKKQRRMKRRALFSAGLRKAVKILLLATIFWCGFLLLAVPAPSSSLNNLRKLQSLVGEQKENWMGIVSDFSESGDNVQVKEAIDDEIIYIFEEGSGIYHSFWGIAKIETFTIKSIVRESFIDNFALNYEVKGSVNDGSFLHLSLNCYDKEGYLLDSVTIFEKVSEGERFKLTDVTYIPLDTSKIVVAAAE